MSRTPRGSLDKFEEEFSEDAIRRRLENFRLLKEGLPPTSEVQVPPRGLERAQQSYDPLQARIHRCLENVPAVPHIHEKFRNLPDVGEVLYDVVRNVNPRKLHSVRVDDSQDFSENATMNRLKDYRVPQHIERLPSALTAQAYNDPLQDKINSFCQNIPALKILEKFKDVPNLPQDPVTTEFKDDRFLKEKAIILERLEDSEMVALGRAYIPMLSSGLSQQGAGALLLLAYNLRDPKNYSLYAVESVPQVRLESDISYSELPSNRYSSQQTTAALSPNVKEFQEAQVYAYIAASTLRLFTIPEENYLKAFPHIINGYHRFYGHRIPFTIPPPSAEGLRTLSFCFSNVTIFKNTLYRILYLGGGTRNSQDLRRFLYEVDLTNSGTHIVSIFIQLCVELNCSDSAGLLLTIIYCREFEKQIDTLVSMIRLMTNKDAEHCRKLWKYGRIFDDTFMSPLRTKKCPLLVYALASALKGVTGEENKNILNIAQLADVSSHNRRRYSAFGEMLVKMVQKHIAEQGSSSSSSAHV